MAEQLTVHLAKATDTKVETIRIVRAWAFAAGDYRSYGSWQLSWLSFNTAVQEPTPLKV